MRIQAGSAAIVGGVFATSLVVGLMVAGRAVFPGAEPSLRPSGVRGVSPTVPAPVPQSPAPSPDPSWEPSAEDFCVLVDQREVYEYEYGAHDVSLLIADFRNGGVAGDDPGLVDAIHAWGQFQLDEIDARAAYAERMALRVPDPGLAADFEFIAMETRLFDEKHSRVARDAATAEEYVAAITALYSDPDLLAISEESVRVSNRVGTYIYVTCADQRYGGGDASIDSADDDAQLIGTAVQEYLVDWEQGDPAPLITSSGGSYYLNDVLIGDQSPSVNVVYFDFVGPDAWCYELNYDGHSPWSVSAQLGVQNTPCP